jgi:hypothetical protein
MKDSDFKERQQIPLQNLPALLCLQQLAFI